MHKFFALLLPLFVFSSFMCRAQKPTETMSKLQEINPLLCDPDSGICEVPGATASAAGLQPLQAIAPATQQKPIRLIYYTDPICSSCWGIEPQLRKLKLEYGHYFDVDYRMGGLLISGIPNFKLEKDVVVRRSELLAAGGVAYHPDTEIGTTGGRPGVRET